MVRVGLEATAMATREVDDLIEAPSRI